MRGIVIAALVGCGLAPRAGAEVVTAPDCEASAGYVTHALAGEIAGGHDYREVLESGWVFVLAHGPFGWDVKVLDSGGMDLTQLTPPYRFAPNPREIYGWHFRNQDNSGPNDGSVNAPQRLRLFSISPSLSGTGGFKPSGDTPADAPEGPSEGRGALTILDYGLADLAPGQQARMVYLKFGACLSWPLAPTSPADTSSTPAVTAEDIERFDACGLSAPYALESYLAPATLSGDFDGDGVLDAAATIVRHPDGKRGVAICLAGRALHVVGIEGALGELTPAYFDRMDYWRVDARDTSPRSAAGGEPPRLRGEGITIAMEEKSSVLLYWDGAAFRSYWQGD
jgi:hypothetical protein